MFVSIDIVLEHTNNDSFPSLVYSHQHYQHDDDIHSDNIPVLPATNANQSHRTSKCSFHHVESRSHRTASIVNMSHRRVCESTATAAAALVDDDEIWTKEMKCWNRMRYPSLVMTMSDIR